MRVKAKHTELKDVGISDHDISRFHKLYTKTDSCWLWNGYKNKEGYARFAYGESHCQTIRVHRLAFFLAGKVAPKDRVLDHLCRVRHCVNPNHLEAVTAGENTLRGEAPSAQNARKTHCMHGHSLHNNVYTFKIKNNRVGRNCRTCIDNRVQVRGNALKELRKLRADEGIIPIFTAERPRKIKTLQEAL